MTDTGPQTPIQTPETPPKGDASRPAGRWVKIALVISVALNLGVAGLVLGARLGDGHRKGMPRDMTFGPFSEALSDADRRELRKGLMSRGDEFRSSREAARAEFKTLLDSLRADPFDPAAMSAALAAIETRNAERLELGRSLIETRLTQMSTEDRLAFADRLEKGLRRGGRD